MHVQIQFQQTKYIWRNTVGALRVRRFSSSNQLYLVNRLSKLCCRIAQVKLFLEISSQLSPRLLRHQARSLPVLGSQPSTSQSAGCSPAQLLTSVTGRPAAATIKDLKPEPPSFSAEQRAASTRHQSSEGQFLWQGISDLESTRSLNPLLRLDAMPYVTVLARSTACKLPLAPTWNLCQQNSINDKTCITS